MGVYIQIYITIIRTAMRYQSLTDILNSAATAVIGAGTYTHAGKLDYSLASIAAPFPHLNTFLPPDNSPGDNLNVRNFRVLLIALDQEPADASPEQKAAILANMDLMIEKFFKAIDTNEFIQVSTPRREPQPRSYAGGVSGYAAEILITGHLQENACLPA